MMVVTGAAVVAWEGIGTSRYMVFFLMPYQYIVVNCYAHAIAIVPSSHAHPRSSEC
jgi:hypothetical protein